MRLSVQRRLPSEVLGPDGGLWAERVRTVVVVWDSVTGVDAEAAAESGNQVETFDVGRTTIGLVKWRWFERMCEGSTGDEGASVK